jgi:hypothetical protein
VNGDKARVTKRRVEASTRRGVRTRVAGVNSAITRVGAIESAIAAIAAVARVTCIARVEPAITGVSSIHNPGIARRKSINRSRTRNERNREQETESAFPHCRSFQSTKETRRIQIAGAFATG